MKYALALLCLFYAMMSPVRSAGQTSTSDSIYEYECSQLFKNLMQHIEARFVDSDADVTDNPPLEEFIQRDTLLMHYITFLIQTPDTNRYELFARMTSETHIFFLRTHEMGLRKLKIRRLSGKEDPLMYSQLQGFRRDNTFVMYHSDDPGKALSYLLFVPKEYLPGFPGPRILSWKLCFTLGVWAYISVTGEFGIEGIFDPREH